MSYQFYKWLHLTSLFIMIFITGMLLASAFTAPLQNKVKKILISIHGTSILVVLFAGFGLLAKGGFMGAMGSGWVITKLVAWVLFGMLPLFLKKVPSQFHGKLIVFYLLTATLVTYLVVNKPF